MRFLIDRCAGQRLADWLRAGGHDVVETREAGPDPGDEAILAWAQREDRVLVTTDKDFGKVIFVESKPHAGVIRLPQIPYGQRILLLDQVHAKHSSDLESGAIVTVKGTRIRVAWPIKAESSS